MRAGTEDKIYPPPPTALPLGLPRGPSKDKVLAGLRVGIFKDWFEDADDVVVAACRAALTPLEQQGAKVRGRHPQTPGPCQGMAQLHQHRAPNTGLASKLM